MDFIRVVVAVDSNRIQLRMGVFSEDDGLAIEKIFSAQGGADFAIVDDAILRILRSIGQTRRRDEIGTEGVARFNTKITI